MIIEILLGLRTMIVSHYIRLWGELFQAERERWAYALPVLIGFGIGLYFLLPFEPPLIIAPVLSLGVLWFLFKVDRDSALHVFLSGVLAVLLGLSAAGVRTALVSTPMPRAKNWRDDGDGHNC